MVILIIACCLHSIRFYVCTIKYKLVIYLLAVKALYIKKFAPIEQRIDD